MPNNMVIQTRGLTKKYGVVTALDHLDLTIEKGQVFGLLGPNGSGKTTTLGLILEVINATSGEFELFGSKDKNSRKERVGAVLESPNFYPYLSAQENLKIVATIKGVDYSRINDVLKTVELHQRASDRFETYSLGMKQRLSIASALLGDPDVLILDEPTNGLDPKGIVEIRTLIQEIAKSGKTLILASHLLSEVQKVCTHIAVLQHGKKLYQGAMDEVMNDQPVIEVGSQDLIGLKSVIQSLGGIKSVSEESAYLVLNVEPEVTIDYISDALREAGISPNHLRKVEQSLEQKFIKILGQNA